MPASPPNQSFQRPPLAALRGAAEARRWLDGDSRMATQDSGWPTTVEEAANSILKKMSADDRDRVQKTKREDLILYHHGWGTGIRNAFGLWKGNAALPESSGCFHPDDCSMRIIERVWEKLQTENELSGESAS